MGDEKGVQIRCRQNIAGASVRANPIHQHKPAAEMMAMVAAT